MIPWVLAIGYFLIGAIVSLVQWRFESLLARHTGRTWTGDPDFQGNSVVFLIWPLFLLIVLFGDSNLEKSTWAEQKMVKPPDSWSFSVNPYGNVDAGGVTGVRASLHKRDAMSLIIGEASIEDDDFDEKVKKLKQKAEERASTLNALED